MKRFLLILPILLILALASTLGVAWACATWIDMHGAPGSLTSDKVRDHVWDTTYLQQRFGHTRINSMRGYLYIDAEWITWSDAPTAVPGSLYDHDIRQRMLAGWPWRAFRCERQALEISIPSKGINIGSMGGRTERGIELKTVGRSFWRALPYEPIWGGLVANTIVYGAAWWLVLTGPFWVRRHIRRRRGRCPECAYDLRGDLPRGCPECGWGREPDFADTAPQ